jgi:hypothetical protein
MNPATLAQQSLDAFLRVMAVVIVIALYAAVSDGPTETDALQLSAEIFNDIAAENAAQHALAASKDQP